MQVVSAIPHSTSAARLRMILRWTFLISLAAISLLILFRAALQRIPSSLPLWQLLLFVLVVEAAVIFVRTDLLMRLVAQVARIWTAVPQAYSHFLLVRSSLTLAGMIFTTLLHGVLLTDWILLAHTSAVWIVLVSIGVGLSEAVCWWAMAVRLAGLPRTLLPVATSERNETASHQEIRSTTTDDSHSELERRLLEDEVAADLQPPSPGYSETRREGLAEFDSVAAVSSSNTVSSSNEARILPALAGNEIESNDVDGEEQMDESVWQQSTRSQIDGQEIVAGAVRERYLADQQTIVSHVVFHPPLGSTPELELHQAEGESADIRTTRNERFGFRVEIRLRQRPQTPSTIVYEFVAMAPLDKPQESER